MSETQNTSALDNKVGNDDVPTSPSLNKPIETNTHHAPESQEPKADVVTQKPASPSLSRAPSNPGSPQPVPAAAAAPDTSRPPSPPAKTDGRAPTNTVTFQENTSAGADDTDTEPASRGTVTPAPGTPGSPLVSNHNDANDDMDASNALVLAQSQFSRTASQSASSRYPTPPNEPAPTTPSLRSSRTLTSTQSTLNTSSAEKGERKAPNFLATLHIPASTYKSLKDVEADNALFADDLLKFRKAQAAQRSLQWQFDELTRLFAKTETTQQQLTTDYGSLFKEKDLLRRHLKTMNREIDRLHFAVLDAQDQREQLRGEYEGMLADAAREREEVAKERDDWKKRVEEMTVQMNQAKEEHAKLLAEECTRHKASISDGLNREAELNRIADEKADNLAKSEAELALERKATRGLRQQLQEVQRYSEELKAHNDNLSTKLAEAQQTIIELRPWEVRYHGLHDRSSKQENDQKTKLDALTQENGQIKTLLKHLVMMMFGMGIKYRVQICGALSRVSALLINVTAQVSKLSGQVSPRSMEAFEHDLSHQLERKKHEVSQLLTGIKKHSVLSLLDSLDTEVAKVAEPVESLVQRVWVLHHTCNSLQQNSIQKTCDFMATMEEHEVLKQNYKHAMEEWKRCDTLYKREQSDKANLMSRINILEREIAQHNRNRRYAQSIESLMKEHAKYQNLQEQIALMRRRVDLLKGEKREEEAKLSQLQENSDVQNIPERETQSQYNMSKPVVLPPYSPGKGRKKDNTASTTTPHAKYGNDMMLPHVHRTNTQSQQLTLKQNKAKHQYRDISPSKDSSRGRSHSKLPMTEAKLAEVENIYTDQGRK